MPLTKVHLERLCRNSMVYFFISHKHRSPTLISPDHLPNCRIISTFRNDESSFCTLIAHNVDGMSTKISLSCPVPYQFFLFIFLAFPSGKIDDNINWMNENLQTDCPWESILEYLDTRFSKFSEFSLLLSNSNLTNLYSSRSVCKRK